MNFYFSSETYVIKFVGCFCHPPLLFQCAIDYYYKVSSVNFCVLSQAYISLRFVVCSAMLDCFYSHFNAVWITRMWVQWITNTLVRLVWFCGFLCHVLLLIWMEPMGITSRWVKWISCFKSNLCAWFILWLWLQCSVAYFNALRILIECGLSELARFSNLHCCACLFYHLFSLYFVDSFNAL